MYSIAVNKNVVQYSSCRICSTFPLRQIFAFHENPYGDTFEIICEAAKNLPKYPLSIARCDNCKLLQLQHDTDLDSQYLEYLYFTKVTNNLSKFYEEIANRYIVELSIPKSKLILDLGSNDGTFLKPFAAAGYRVLGVDPSRPAAAQSEFIGIQVLNEYFSDKTVAKIKDLDTDLGLISVNYTLANVPDVSNFFQNISDLANSETFISIITGYHPEQFEINMFDYIGHDHLSYFTVSDIDKLARKFNFQVIDVERVEHKGGSVRLLLSKSPGHIRSSVFQMLQKEKWMLTTSDSKIFEMLSRVEISKHHLGSLIAGNQLIGGVGASISTSYLMVHYEIVNCITFLFDDDPRKIGRYSPGGGIEVKDLESLSSMNVNCIIILAWQHTQRLLVRLQEVKFKGKVIIPLPYVQVVEL